MPSSILGVLGGGQLGRMLAMEARRLGYRVVCWTGGPEIGPAAMANVVLNESFDSPHALDCFTGLAETVTVEFENIPSALLERLEAQLPLAPGAQAIAICQHREREKRFLSGQGFPSPWHAIVNSADSLRLAMDGLPGNEGILKTAEFGYDGKGQRAITHHDDAESLWKAFHCPRAVLEEKVDLEGELSVLVVRNAEGQAACYEPAENFHRHHILDLSLVPARYAPAILEQARSIAMEISRALNYEGIMAVEFFLSKDGRLLVNELAPRPHNSGHHTLDACQTSQFEQQLRVACSLPIGGTRSITPSVMMNLLGDLWPQPDRAPDWTPILSTPGAKLHLYGKAAARPGRKMGHVTFTGTTLEAALEAAARCRQAFGLPQPTW